QFLQITQLHDIPHVLIGDSLGVEEEDADHIAVSILISDLASELFDQFNGRLLLVIGTSDERSRQESSESKRGAHRDPSGRVRHHDSNRSISGSDRSFTTPMDYFPSLIASIFFHNASGTGITDSRAMRTSSQFANDLSALIAASVTGFFSFRSGF